MSEQPVTVAGLLRAYRAAAGWPPLRVIAVSAGLSTASCGNILAGTNGGGSLASVLKVAAALRGDAAAVQDCWLQRYDTPPPELPFDAEARLIEGLVQALEPLSVAARVRVIRYLVSRFSIRLEDGK